MSRVDPGLLVRSLLLVFLLEGGALPQAAAQVPSHPDTLTFDRATALLLEHNPRLRAARARVRAEAQSARAASLFPNPSLGVSEERTNLPGEGVDDQWYLSLTQPLNYPGEQRARGRSADAARTAAEAALEETRASLYNTLRHRYLDVAVAQTRRRILRRFAEAVQQAARAGDVRYEEGDLGPVPRSRLKVAQAEMENALAEVQQQLRTARTELAAVVRSPVGSDAGRAGGLSTFVVADSIQFRPLHVNPTWALQAARDQRGRLRAQQARVQRERQSLTAVRYQQYPDLSISAGPKRQSIPGGVTYGFTAGLQMELPLWDGGRTALEAQQGRRDRAEATLDAMRRTVEVQVRRAVDRLNSYRTRLQSVADTTLRDTGSLLQDALFTYEQGEITLFELLDTIDAARRARLLQVRLKAGYLRALYDLEYAVGVGPGDASRVVEGALVPRSSPRFP